MTLAPLLNAPAVIQLHAVTAIAALGLGIMQLAAPKGTLPHRSLGYLWVALMVTVAASGLLIHEIRLWGPWSPIHILSVYTLVMLPLGVWRAHRHNVPSHRSTMIGIFVGGLLIAGVLSFLPGRIMHATLFGS